MNVNSQQQQRQAALQAQAERDRKARDLRMMQDPGRWPRMGRLPLKKRDGRLFLEPDYCGFLNCWDEVKPIVYIANIFGVVGDPIPGQPDCIRSLKNVPQKAYASFEELAEEWTVD